MKLEFMNESPKNREQTSGNVHDCFANPNVGIMGRIVDLCN